MNPEPLANIFAHQSFQLVVHILCHGLCIGWRDRGLCDDFKVEPVVLAHGINGDKCGVLFQGKLRRDH